MKKLLFVINSLTIGGSEKSLVSLLNLINYSKYSVDLLMLKRGEEFDKYIPNEVNILQPPKYYRYLYKYNSEVSIKEKLKFILCRYKCSIGLRINGKILPLKNNQQIFYENQKNILDSLEKKYDFAISYAQGFPTYFVSDKVKANKKIAWINCDYIHTAYDKKLDKNYYKNIDKIIAVSESGKKSILEVDRDYRNKVEVIKDIVNPELIQNMSSYDISELDESCFNILTVARLVKGYKGYDLAVKAAKILKNDGYNFKWYAVGDGHDRYEIEKIIKHYKLEENFILLGSKDNPYPYMKKCDLYVQPSRVEGFGLTVIEAKILKKLIVCTNFKTASELIVHNENGLIVKMDEVSIADGIKKYINDEKFKNKIYSTLLREKCYDSINEINKLYKLFGD